MTPRPRFSRELEPLTLKLPPGKQIGGAMALSLAPNGDLFLLHSYGAANDPPGDGTDLPNVVHCAPDGTFINAWGGPDHIPAADGIQQWPVGQEGIDCDAEGNVWVFGYLLGDNAVLKFSKDGQLLLRIGQRDKRSRNEPDDHDTKTLNGPTSCYHDVAAREVFVSDGYGNHRVVAFNSDTGEFTRMWGAYGKNPWDQSAEDNYGSPVHKVVRGPNGLIYVCDRRKNRIQEFELVPGGARYLREVTVAPGTEWLGACWDVAFTPDAKYMFVCDGTNSLVWTVDVDSFTVLGSDDVYPDPTGGREGTVAHRFAMDTNGDLILACPGRGFKRMRYLGVS